MRLGTCNASLLLLSHTPFSARRHILPSAPHSPFSARRSAHTQTVYALVVYGAGLVSMLTCSAAYNTLEGAPFMFEKWKKTADLIWWKNSTEYLNCLDRSMIFVMIAGTYTPVIAVLLRVRIRAQDTFYRFPLLPKAYLDLFYRIVFYFRNGSITSTCSSLSGVLP